jgi:hypothetical protein
MSRMKSALDEYSHVWERVFSFHTFLDDHAAIDSLRAIGVSKVAFYRGRTASGETITNVTAVEPSKGVAVDVGWLKRIQELCEELGPHLDAEVVRVAGPDGDDHDTDCRDLIAREDLLLFARVGFAEETSASVGVNIPVTAVATTTTPA